MRYRVEGAIGSSFNDATNRAALAALIYAGRSISGDPTQKAAVESYLSRNKWCARKFVSKGNVFRRTFGDNDSVSLDMFVTVNKKALRIHLEKEARVITDSKELSEGVGTPTILVIFSGSICKRRTGSSSSEVCRIDDRLKSQLRRVQSRRSELERLENSLLKSDCMKQEITVDASKSSSSGSDHSISNTRSSGQHSSKNIGAYGYGPIGSYGAGQTFWGSSSQQAYRRHHFSQSAYRKAMQRFLLKIRPSRHCRPFINRISSIDKKIDRELSTLDKMFNAKQRYLQKLKGLKGIEQEITSRFLRLGWHIIENDQEFERRRMINQHLSAAEQSKDKHAAIAERLGADIYVEWGFSRGHTGDGGYQSSVWVTVYESGTARKLAGDQGISRTFAFRNEARATREAVGRVMGKIIEDVKARWAEMARSGVRYSVVLRGNFGSDVMSVVGVLYSLCRQGQLKNRCKFEPTLRTQKTIEGHFSIPSSYRNHFGVLLYQCLKKAGFTNVREVKADRSGSIFSL